MAIVGLFAVIPWAVVRLAVGILEMDVWTPESERTLVDHGYDEVQDITTNRMTRLDIPTPIRR